MAPALQAVVVDGLYPGGSARPPVMDAGGAMVETAYNRKAPFGLVVTGEAELWLESLELIVGPDMLVPYRVRNDRELLEVVQSGIADAAVLDDEASRALDVLKVLRMVRRLDRSLPVVVVTARTDRRLLEDALGLAAYSVVAKPLELEELLRQILGMMRRLEQLLRGER